MVALVATDLHGLDVVEQWAEKRGFQIHRSQEAEIDVFIQGRGALFQINIRGLAELAALHFACGFELQIPKKRFSEAMRLTAYLNEKLYIGQFDVWDDKKYVTLRHALVLVGEDPTQRQCNDLTEYLVKVSEKMMPLFILVAKHNYTVEEAIQMDSSFHEGTA